MKRILFILSMLIGVAYGQVTGHFRFDSTMLYKNGGNNELILLNGSRAITGGVLTNIGNGRTRFITPVGSTNTSIGTGYKVAVDGTNNMKSLGAGVNIVLDSATSGQIGITAKNIATDNLTQTTVTRNHTISDGTNRTLNFLGNNSAISNAIVLTNLNFRVGQAGSTVQFQASQGTTIVSAPAPANNSYIQLTGGLAYIRTMDSIEFAVGDPTSIPSATSYVKILPFSQDSYAPDSVTWRLTDRSALLTFNATGWHAWQNNGEYYFYNVARETDSTGLDILAWDRAASEMKRIPSDLLSGGATPTWQQTLDAGSTTDKDNTIVNGANTLTITNNTLANSQGVILSSSSTAAIANQTMLLSQLSGTNANSGVESFGVRGSVARDGTGSINTGIFGSASQGATSNTAVWGQATDGVTAIGGLFEASGATNNYAVQLVDGTEGVGKVLTSDATGKASWATPSAGGITVGTTTITSGTTTRILYDNAGVLGEYTISGSGNVAMTTSPVLTTPNIGVASGTSVTLSSLTSGRVPIVSTSGLITDDAGLLFDPTSNTLRITGTSASVTNGPKIAFDYTGDANSVMSYFAYTHDNIAGPVWDAYYNGSSWVSSFTSSNFALYKNTDQLAVGYNSGTTTGSTFGGFNLTDGVRFTNNGRLGIGVAATAKLHLVASTTSASTASIKINEGSRQTTPEDGTINYVSNNLEFVEASTVYTLAKTLRATATLNFDLSAVNSQDLTITVTGAASGDAVSLGLDPASVAADITFFGWVSAANTVTVRCSRVGGGGAVDPASGTFLASVIKY